MNDQQRDAAIDSLDNETEALRLVCCALVGALALASGQNSRAFAAAFFAGVRRDLAGQSWLGDEVGEVIQSLEVLVMDRLPGAA